jgi:CheY-like chemotaxis protein
MLRLAVLRRQHVRILCVDDDPALTETLRDVLEPSGYDVDTAANGLVALKLIDRFPAKYPLVITDMRMPGLDGYRLISEARLAGYAGRFIAYAGALSSDDHQRLRDLTVVRVIEKPGRVSQILDAVREALNGH